MIVIILIPLLPLSYSEFKWQQLESQGSKIVQQVSGKPEGHLKCQRLSSALLDIDVMIGGYVSYDKPNTAVLKYEFCQDLKGFFKHKEPTFNEFFSYHILLHEARHVEGYHNEADTECMAIGSHSLYPELINKNPEHISDFSKKYYFEYYPNLHKSYKRADKCLKATLPLIKEEVIEKPAE